MQACFPGLALWPAVRWPSMYCAAAAAPGEAVSIAAVNGPTSVVVSGWPTAMHLFCRGCERDGIHVGRSWWSHAFHSAAMDPALPDEHLSPRWPTFASPRVPILSNTTVDSALSANPATTHHELRTTGPNLREPVEVL